MTALADMEIGSSSITPDALLAGRRLRVFARMVRCTQAAREYNGFGYVADDPETPRLFKLLAVGHPVTEFVTRPTYSQALAAMAHEPEYAAVFARLPLRINASTPSQVTTLAEIIDQQVKGAHFGNPSLPDALQDLGDEIAIDVHEACVAFEDPGVFYAGVDEGIEPVTDAHVALVIAALQRELNRELRDKSGVNYGDRLPAAPLALLPWRVQRALAERRRLRYAQWGIGAAEWESGYWSLWNVPDDPGWLPRQVTDGRTAFGVVS